MRHIKKFRYLKENIDWDKPYKEIEKDFLSEVNRIHKKMYSGVYKYSLSGFDLSWSGSGKHFLKASKRVKDEFEDLKLIESIYDEWYERLLTIKDSLREEDSLYLKWVYDSKHLEADSLLFRIGFEVDDKIDFNGFVDIITELRGVLKITNVIYWSIEERSLMNEKACLEVYFRVDK